MQFAVWMFVLAAWLLGAAVEAFVHLPVGYYYELYKNRTETKNVDTQLGPKAKFVAAKKAGFRPSASLCCKVGYKMAKKKLSCGGATVHSLAKKSNASHKSKAARLGGYSKKLFRKVSRCSANFSKNLEKCCHYKMQFYKKFRQCRNRPKSVRKACRKSVKDRFRG